MRVVLVASMLTMNGFPRCVCSLREALLGFSFSFTHLDGRTVEVSRKEVTPPG
jgi:hypothetical protein